MSWLQITAGRGPAECQRFVHRLVEEISAEAADNELRCELIDAKPGAENATLQSALLVLEGQRIESFLASWEGTHKWICPSPFRPNHGRKNWFASMKAFSEPAQSVWTSSEIRIDTFRSSGPGGQHANKTSSAIRVTYLPTGIVVVAQEERSQHRNRSLALARLYSALKSKDLQVQQSSEQDMWMEHGNLERGNEVRVYEGEKFRLKKSG